MLFKWDCITMIYKSLFKLCNEIFYIIRWKIKLWIVTSRVDDKNLHVLGGGAIDSTVVRALRIAVPDLGLTTGATYSLLSLAGLIPEHTSRVNNEHQCVWLKTTIIFFLHILVKQIRIYDRKNILQDYFTY